MIDVTVVLPVLVIDTAPPADNVASVAIVTSSVDPLITVAAPTLDTSSVDPLVTVVDAALVMLTDALLVTDTSTTASSSMPDAPARTSRPPVPEPSASTRTAPSDTSDAPPAPVLRDIGPIVLLSCTAPRAVGRDRHLRVCARRRHRDVGQVDVTVVLPVLVIDTAPPADNVASVATVTSSVDPLVTVAAPVLDTSSVDPLVTVVDAVLDTSSVDPLVTVAAPTLDTSSVDPLVTVAAPTLDTSSVDPLVTVVDAALVMLTDASLVTDTSTTASSSMPDAPARTSRPPVPEPSASTRTAPSDTSDAPPAPVLRDIGPIVLLSCTAP
ncbi:hypothetical protein PPROV_000782600 [Pycnococcus provasolii]|uniref:Uncharacterized protein n=1 Tax=Pycnococcus provasolii TaxID=41880 RepID=A0A830HW32_9CHLO|nr:hypothetical protein PPROV_000782600 [Pycnococcus provasolii]